MVEQITIVVLILLGLLGCISCFLAKKHDKKIMEEKEQIKREIEENKKRYFKENNIPDNAYLIRCTNRIVEGMPIEGKWNVFLWKENNIINLCGQNESDGIRKIEIKIESIKYYDRNGDYRVDAVTEGGGVNVGNAIVGGIVGAIIGAILMGVMGMIVAFGIGALLAGRNKTITKNKEIDNRKTYLYYSEDNEDKKIIFTSKDYEILLKLIPEKEMGYIENNKILKANDIKNDNVYIDIEKLSELKDKGILTEEEFGIKKQLLLDKIQ